MTPRAVIELTKYLLRNVALRLHQMLSVLFKHYSSVNKSLFLMSQANDGVLPSIRRRL